MRQIATKAGLILSNDPHERLVNLSEAAAVSLYCERKYCTTTNNWCRSKVFG
jgi:hypothetical protein